MNVQKMTIEIIKKVKNVEKTIYCLLNQLTDIRLMLVELDNKINKEEEKND